MTGLSTCEGGFKKSIPVVISAVGGYTENASKMPPQTSILGFVGRL